MNDSNLPALHGALVHVLALNGTRWGIGFLVDRKRVLTCAHVVTNADPKQRQVRLRFPYLNHAEMMATVEFLSPAAPPPDGTRTVAQNDIAVLLLPDDAPDGSHPACLFMGEVNDGDPCWVHGIPNKANTGEQWTSGNIQPKQGNGWRGVFPDNSKKPIVGGYSGSPVTTTRGLVLGMVVAFENPSTEAYMIPARVLREVCPSPEKLVAIEREHPYLKQGEVCELARYARWALKKHGELELVGLGGGDLPLELEEVYVPLRLAFQGMRREQVEGHSGSVELQDVFQHSANKPVTLLGQPGSGKTTALRKMLYLCLKEGGQVLGLPPEVLPVFLRLRRFDTALLDQPLESFIDIDLAEMSEGADLPKGLGQRLWQRGHLLLLFDGLDEISDPTLRQQVAQKLERDLFQRSHKHVWIVISSRIAGFEPVQEHFGNTFGFEVQPLDPKQIEQFVTLWFKAAFIKQERGTPEQARKSAQVLLEGLGREENDSWRIQGLTGSPLLLALLCLVVLQGGEIPRRRVGFYEECLRVLLQRWGHHREESPLLDLDTAQALLQEVAWRLHEAGQRDTMTRTQFVLWAEARLAELGYPEADGFAVLTWLHHRTGVISEYAKDRYGFMHLGFQEYLAASHIARNRQMLSVLCGHAGEHVDGEDWWQEVISLLAGMAERTLFRDLVETLLQKVVDPKREDLLRKCLDEAKEPDLTPFLEQLQPQTFSPVLMAVLRILKGDRWQGVAELRQRVIALQQATTDANVKYWCDQLLTPPKATDKEFHLLLIHGPQEAGVVQVWHQKLHGLGLNLWPERQPWRDDIPRVRQKVAAAAVFVGASPPPWSDQQVKQELQVLANRMKIYLVPLPGAPKSLSLPWNATWPTINDSLSLAGWVRGSEGPSRATELIEPKTGLRLLFISGATFTMGSDDHEPEERPAHEVRLSDYWLGETPVTNEQYRCYLQATKAEESAFWRNPRFSDPMQPVVGVSWNEAKAFCHWLNEGSGQNFRFTLPSEAQWEFAARGTDGRDYPWGNEKPTKERACFGQQSSYGKPALVGSFPDGRGPFGHLDLAGNVWEWCLDGWSADYQWCTGEKRFNPMGPGRDSRVLRGGSWFLPADRLRAAYRLGDHAGGRYGLIGFRVAAAPASL
ncbi:MAG: SUMF1/EgtB/PvdO family nonheme iron enzyme [Magnetococcales bacterium]|nr:SUMF1/EgtB/PvdO family nonheme iron enzyme [Magnetococcales bacterium]